MKIISVLLLLIFVTDSNLKANVAQPGIWNAGGGKLLTSLSGRQFGI